MSLYSFHIQMITRSKTNTVDALAYRSGSKVVDSETGGLFDRTDKAVQHVALMVPEDAPQWAKDLQELIAKDRLQGVQTFCDLVEGAEKRKDAQLYREFRLSLPRELTEEQNKQLVREFIGDQCCLNGMTALLNFHFDQDEETGETNPHCHVLLLTRRLTERGLSDLKERNWNRKTFHETWREQWAAYGNFHLKMHGYEANWDHRSYAERGIDLEPQPKLGSNVRKQEARLGRDPQDIESQASTATGTSFRDVKLRNLYRIVSRPTLVFDIVTRHQATFMWGDVQKVLARYIDDPALFMRMDVKLKASRDLVYLKEVENAQDPNLKERAVYTTRQMLREETALVGLAGSLDAIKSHGIKQDVLETVLSRHDEALKAQGFGGFSEDQKTAIRHLVSEGPLKCLVGYAGAGKTTALKTARAIWKESGYQVYGLAPTGRAARNLEGEGIPSTTLHTFLKDYEKGRAQYNPKTILVLDEAGMVDLERGAAFLKAVKALGAKAVLVGDGAQLQPVEAGPFFRLVTDKVPASRLETVVRQREAWQQEATKLFGQLQTREALARYQAKGALKRVSEPVLELSALRKAGDLKGVVDLYRTSRSVSGHLYASMKRDLLETYFLEKNVQKYIPLHPDFESFERWQQIRRETVQAMMGRINAYKPFLADQGISSILLAKELVDRNAPRFEQEKAVQSFVETWGDWKCLTPYQGTDLRVQTRQTLLQDWKASFLGNPDKSHLILVHTNRDVRALNTEARHLMKEAGLLAKEERCYTIQRLETDDFGHVKTFSEERSFARGDRLIFLRNDRSLHVSNGMLGTIEALDKQKIQVRLDEGGRLVSFAPKLYPFFDQGWAVTIHKAQGVTVEKSYVVASPSMNRNVTYVAMTRHRESVDVYGSDLEFLREERLLKDLSKVGDKLSGKDYLGPEELEKLARSDETLLKKALERLGGHLEAMGYVSRRTWQAVSSKLTGRPLTRQEMLPEVALTEESRSHLEAIAKIKKEALKVEEVGEATPLRKTRALGAEQAASGSEPSARSGVSRARPEIFHERGEDLSEGQGKLQEGAPSSASQTKVFKDLTYYYREDVIARMPREHLEQIFSAHIQNWVYNNRAIHRSRGEIRFGARGSFVVNTLTGTWYSHEQQVGGDVFSYLAQSKGISYGQAIQELGDRFKAPQSTYLTAAEQEERYQAWFKAEKAVKEAKALKTRETTQKVFDKSLSLEGTLAERYLRDVRGIQGELPQDLRFSPAEKAEGKTYPALLVFARTPDGSLGNFQKIYLDPKTGGKADLEVKKRTIGSAPTAAVRVQEGPRVTFMAEGIETALSLKEAGVKGEILAGFGITVFRNAKPSHNRVVLVADYDGPEAPSHKALEKSKILLEEKGYQVSLLWPTQTGDRKTDFNDILRHHGKDDIQRLIQEQIPEVSFHDGQKSTHASQSHDRDTAAPKTQETLPSQEVSQKSDLKDTLFKQNALAYFERELARPYTKSMMNEALKAELDRRISTDPISAAHWWHEEWGGKSFDPAVSMEDQIKTENPAASDTTKRTICPEDYSATALKVKIENLDRKINIIEAYRGLIETDDKQLQTLKNQRNDLFGSVSEQVLSYLKEKNPEMAQRVEEHRAQQQQQIQQRQRNQGITL